MQRTISGVFERLRHTQELIECNAMRTRDDACRLTPRFRSLTAESRVPGSGFGNASLWGAAGAPLACDTSFTCWDSRPMI